jgi:hypothetical protein
MQLDNGLVRMNAKEYHPLSLVEDAEFRRYVQMLCALDITYLAGRH